MDSDHDDLSQPDNTIPPPHIDLRSSKKRSRVFSASGEPPTTASVPGSVPVTGRATKKRKDKGKRKSDAPAIFSDPASPNPFIAATGYPGLSSSAITNFKESLGEVSSSE